MKKSSSVLLSFSLILSTLYLSFPTAYASETCTTDSGSGNGKNHVGEICIKKPSGFGENGGDKSGKGNDKLRNIMMLIKPLMVKHTTHLKPPAVLVLLQMVNPEN